MADATLTDGEFSDANMVEITEGEASTKFSGLSHKITELEGEYDKDVRENEGYRKQIQELTASVEELNNEKSELNKQYDKAKSEKKAFGSVADRAAELEGVVSMLQHDLASAESDLHDANAEMSETKKDLEGVRERDKEKDSKLLAPEKERDLLLSEVGKLESVVIDLRNELNGVEKEKLSLKVSVEELQAAAENVKVLEKSKNELEKTVEEMKERISALQGILKETTGFEVEEIGVMDEVKGGGLKGKKWAAIWGTTTAAIVVAGVACYLHATRKH